MYIVGIVSNRSVQPTSFHSTILSLIFECVNNIINLRIAPAAFLLSPKDYTYQQDLEFVKFRQHTGHSKNVQRLEICICIKLSSLACSKYSTRFHLLISHKNSLQIITHEIKHSSSNINDFGEFNIGIV